MQAVFRLEDGKTDVQDWEVERVVLGHHHEIWGLAPHPNRSTKKRSFSNKIKKGKNKNRIVNRLQEMVLRES